MTNAAEILQENLSLKNIISVRDTTIQQKNSRIKLLEDYILALKHKQYGASSEKLDAIQVDIFEEEEIATAECAEAESEAITEPAPSRKRRRVSIPKALPPEFRGQFT
jgi:transposase